jgi:hypothetical protein
MVGSVAAAAGGQARFVAGAENRVERAQGEEQNQQEGEAAPHLFLMLHEILKGELLLVKQALTAKAHMGRSMQLVGYHQRYRFITIGHLTRPGSFQAPDKMQINLRIEGILRVSSA